MDLKEFVFAQGLKEIEEQSKDFEHLDSKAGLLLGFSVVAVAELLGFLFLVAAEGQKSISVGHPRILGPIFVIAVVLLLGGSISALQAIYPSDFQYWTALEEMPGISTIDQLWDRQLESVRTIAKENEDSWVIKNNHYRRAAGFLAWGFALQAAMVVAMYFFLA